jgi:phosphonate transport system substrate-binding protein
VGPSRAGELVFATYLAPNIRPVYQAVTERVASALGRPARLITATSFDEVREARIDFAFICGLPYVRLRREAPSALEAIAAPILSGERYAGRPVYFSDVITSASSPASSFADLRGCAWAYNEPDSHSGYLVTLFNLLRLGESRTFFGRTEMTGFHQESIARVAAGRVDASAVDSQVLEVELRADPPLAARLPVIGTFGPSTIQPLAATRAVPDSLRSDVQEVVCGPGTAVDERAVLDAGAVHRFAKIGDSAYDDIRAMLDAVESAALAF